MKISKKIPMLIAGMIVVLGMMCFVGSTALAGDETVSAYVYSETEFRSAIGNPADHIISIAGDFDLTDDVNIERKVEITSATGSAIDVKSHSIIIDNGGDVAVSGDIKVTGSSGIGNTTIKVNGGAVSISGGIIEATGFGGRGVSIEGGGTATISGGIIEARGIALNVLDGGTANISGGVIEARGIALNVSDGGTANISGGVIEATGSGVWVEGGGTVNISGGNIKAKEQTGAGVDVRSGGKAEISGGNIIAMGMNGRGVRSLGDNSTATISGGVIEATGSGGQGVSVSSGSTVRISGGNIRAMGDSGANRMGVFIIDSNSRIEISGTAQISSNDFGVFVAQNSSAEISGNVQISGTEYGVYVQGGTASITIASSLSPVITNGVYGFESMGVYKAFLTTLPEPITMTATESYDITIEGVDPSVGFALDPGTSDELNGQLNNDGNVVTMNPEAEGSYTLLVTSQIGIGHLHLRIPVTVLPAALPTYTVTYHGNNHTGGTVPVDSNSYTSGSTVTVLGNTGNLTRTGYSFAGWKDGSTNYAPGDTFTITNDVTLDARWTATSSGGSSGRGGGSSSGSSGSGQEKQEETEEIEETSPPQKKILLTIGKLETTINDTTYQLDALPFVDPVTNRTLVPIRFISEALGVKVDWLADTRQILITDGEIEILLTIGSKEALVNGEIIMIDSEPTIIPPGRTFVPLRVIGELLGATVEYNEVTREISIVR